MKAKFYTSVSLGVALSVLLFVAGSTQQDASQSASFLSTASAEPAVAAIGSNTPAESPTSPAALAEIAPVDAVPVPAPALDSEKKLPANLKPSTPAGEIIKLAQAGVDETVMLNYITNAGNMFSLNSDDIIYLNDLGVANTVVMAMMQRDQGLKASWAQPTSQPPQVAAQPEPTAAPAYANPLQPEPPPATAEAAAPPAANVSYNNFYDSLAPYGTWVEVEGYGRCWQPTVVVVNRGWQPYSDRGHWVYTDSGWYWMSDYSWGWAPFHYGRWLDHPRWGWCWWPDRVWAPSWVSWRYSGDYCGWAPLPPAAYYRTGFGFSYYGRSVGLSFDFGLGADCFTFVSWNHFRDNRPWHYRVGLHQVHRIYNTTTIVNNYGTGRNNTVINHGIPADRVREHTRTELHPVRIRDHTETAGPSRGGRGERLEHDGRSLIVNRPHIPESAAARPPMAPPSRAEATVVGANGVGSGARAQEPRPPGRDSRTEGVRDRGNRSNGSTHPASGATVYTRSAPTPTLTAPAPRTREDRPENSNRDRKHDGSQTPSVTPLLVNGSGNSSATRPLPSPPGSVVVIGRRDANPVRERTTENERRSATTRTGTSSSAPRPASSWSGPTTTASAGQYTTAPTVQPSRAPAYTPPSQPARVTREERYYTPPQSSYTSPRPTYTPQPSYTPRPSAPAPVYTMPAPAPAPRSYSVSQPAPAPAYAPPPSRSQPTESRSTPERSSSGGRDNGRNRQDR